MGHGFHHKAIYSCRMLDVIRLRVLVAVAQHGSVTAAARALNYAQPSISHHMARLEAETGARLLERSGRGVRLTDAGRLLAERAEEIIGRLDAAEAELAAHVGLREGRVRLAAFPSALGTIVPAAAARLEAETPGMDLMLTEAEPPEALRMLRAGYVDVALVFQHYQQDTDPAPPSAGEDGTRGRLLLDEPVHLVTAAAPAPPAHGLVAHGPVAHGPATNGPAANGPAANSRAANSRAANSRAAHAPAAHAPAAHAPAEHPAGQRDGVPDSPLEADLSAYASHRWIAGCERCRSYLIRQCALAGFTPKVAFTTDDYVAVQALVAAGLGVTTLPGLCLRAARHPGIVATPLPGARRHIFAVTYGDPPDPPATARLLDVLAQVAGADAATGHPESPALKKSRPATESALSSPT
jgi:DNA-binding transcriptional LysR family regulator